MSIVSDARRASVSSFAISICFSEMAFSMALRTSFASCPITGRSSALSLPICLRIAVSAPFFPRYFTRRVSRALASLTAASTAAASERIASSCSFMLSIILSRHSRIILKPLGNGIKKALSRKQDKT